MSSLKSAWLLCPLECSPQKQNDWTLRFCFWGWIMWKMCNKTITEFGFRMISWIIKTSFLCYLPKPKTQTSVLIIHDIMLNLNQQEPRRGWNRAIKNTATQTVRLSDNFGATDWNCWEIVQNPTAREYTSRCNTAENIHVHKVIGPWDRVIFVGETEGIIREVPLVRSPKEVIVLIFIFL